MWDQNPNHNPSLTYTIYETNQVMIDIFSHIIQDDKGRS
jgi:hypothetical protein